MNPGGLSEVWSSAQHALVVVGDFVQAHTLVIAVVLVGVIVLWRWTTAPPR